MHELEPLKLAYYSTEWYTKSFFPLEAILDK